MITHQPQRNPSANCALKSTRLRLSLVGTRATTAITANLVTAGPGDELAIERRNPFTKDGDIKPEWSKSMSERNREILECMSILSGPNPDDKTANLLRSAAICFRGAPTGQVIQNVRTRILKPNFFRCSWPICPKTCGPNSIQSHSAGLYRDVFVPAVNALNDPEFWIVVPALELPDVYSTKNLVQIAASYAARKSGGIRLNSWLTRQDGRHYPIIDGREWLGYASLSLTMGDAVSFTSLNISSSSEQTPPQLAWPMVLAVGRGAEFRPELLERRWLGLQRNLNIGLPRLYVVPSSDLLFAWSFYLDWWALTWFEGRKPMDLARLALAWRRQELNILTPLGPGLQGQVGKRRKEARAKRAGLNEWVRYCNIQDLGESTEAGVWRAIAELNQKVGGSTAPESPLSKWL